MSYPLPVLQIEDVSQYEFEEFCEKWCFYFYERAFLRGRRIGLKEIGEDQYLKMWAEFSYIQPNIFLKYEFETSLGTRIIFHPSSNDIYEIFYTFEIKQMTNNILHNDKIDNL